MLVLAVAICSAQLSVTFEPGFPALVEKSVFSLLSPFNPVLVAPSTPPAGQGMLLSFGASAACPSGFSSNVSEAFQIVALPPSNGQEVYCVSGNPSAHFTGRIANSGLVYGSFELLQNLGFSFLHPLFPSTPLALKLSPRFINDKRIQSPHFYIRGVHYHSEHPLDLTEYLNGYDSVDMLWADMSTEFESYLTWLAAHKVNRLEFVVLCPDDNLAKCQNATRTARLTQVVAIAHAYGIAVVADIALAIKQQHAMRMIYSKDIHVQISEIQQSVDWALGSVGFDAISTEAGTSEFTSTSCEASLVWYNTLSGYIDAKFGSFARSYIKMHVSQGQHCPNYTSPIGAGPINFNFLPIYANLSLGVMPHTVQVYTLSDPTSGTYGNANFSDIFNIGQFSMGQERETVFYPEASYWVGYDSNVPLFYGPLYAYRAASDTRKVANFSGTMLFESGWEYGYWISSIAQVSAFSKS